jgi:hypothetical protein
LIDVEAITIDLTEEQIHVLLGILANNLGEKMPISDSVEMKNIMASFSFLQRSSVPYEKSIEKNQNIDTSTTRNAKINIASSRLLASAGSNTQPPNAHTVLQLISQPPPATREHLIHLEVRLAQPVAFIFFTGTGMNQGYSPVISLSLCFNYFLITNFIHFSYFHRNYQTQSLKLIYICSTDCFRFLKKVIN